MSEPIIAVSKPEYPPVEFLDSAELIARITILAMEISKAGKYHVFAQYSGHVDWFEVRVLPGSQVYERAVPHNRLFESCVSLGHDDNADKRHLETAYATLQRFARESAA